MREIQFTGNVFGKTLNLILFSGYRFFTFIQNQKVTIIFKLYTNNNKILIYR